MCFKLFRRKPIDRMKYLIVGLGNIGSKYENTRHNIGFMALDNFIRDFEGASFSLERHAYVSNVKHRGRSIILIKPTTFVNLSGKALRYWMNKERVPIENVLIITDDLAFGLGKIKIRMNGGDGGHNGLRDIISTLGHNKFNRLRFGIGDDFSRGKQVDYVLGEWTEGELAEINLRLDLVNEIIKSFVSIGIDRTMNIYNKR